jgi:F-type H+-transporting ATPase subunit alpha
MRGPGKAVLEAIRQQKQITDDIRAKLKAEIDGFAKNFA